VEAAMTSATTWSWAFLRPANWCPREACQEDP